MSEYLPSFIIEPVLRQARRFSERIGGDDSPAAGGGGDGAAAVAGSGFSLPVVPDFQRFYPSRFWTQSPPLASTVPHDTESAVHPALHPDHVPEEGTWRSIARNVQLWASQINNLDVEDEVVQESVLQSIERDPINPPPINTPLTLEPESLHLEAEVEPFPPLEATLSPASRSLPVLDLLRQPQRTASDTSANPAHELSNRSQILEHDIQRRSQSDPFAGTNGERPPNMAAHEDSRDALQVMTYSRDGEGSAVLPEDDGMKTLRHKINAVWAGPGTAQDKSRWVHALMTERYRSSRAVTTPTSSTAPTSPPFRATSPLSLPSIRSEEVVFNLVPSDLQPTYSPSNPDEEVDDMTGQIRRPELGCVHYKRNVKMQCAQCERWYTCRLCHDEKEDHQLPRRATRHMLCMICNTPQSVSQVCRMCHVQAACYYCSICKLWNNDTDKAVYHCDDCGICRLGQGLGKDFFHCQTCAACISISAESTHRCIEKSTKCDCPICGEYMFTSSQPVTIMRCGHSIHDTCFVKWCNASYKCPICSRSIANMESQFRRLDRHIAEQPMPLEYSNNRAYVFCNDCNGRSVVKYHWLGLKCAVCDSYNTAQLELLGAEDSVIQEQADRAQELGIGEAAMTASQSQTPVGEVQSPPARPSPSSRPATLETANSSALPSPSDSGGTYRNSVPIPNRRDSPFHNLPHSPSRSVRAASPVVGSYFGTGQRPSLRENRRGSYLSVLSFGTTTEDTATQNASPAQSPSQASWSSSRPQSLRLLRPFLSPPADRAIVNSENVTNGSTLIEDDDEEEKGEEEDEMDFWGGHSPRSQDADIVDLDTGAVVIDGEEDDSSTDDEDEMDYEEDGEDDDDEDDPMDLLIGHR